MPPGTFLRAPDGGHREMPCKGKRADGSSCGAPERLVDPSSGYCWQHDPANEKARIEAAKRGGAVAALKWKQQQALEDQELPPLDSPQAAERWSEIIGRAVALGRLSNSQGQTMLRAVNAFLKSHDAGTMAERLERLQEQVARLKEARA